MRGFTVEVSREELLSVVPLLMTNRESVFAILMRANAHVLTINMKRKYL